jgi:expansin (peptidoglycan-binding protein)
MSAAPRTVSTAPDLRSLALAFGAVIAAAAIVLAVALARPASIQAPASVAPATTTQWDHGTTSATSGTRALTVSGTRGGGILYTGIPYQAYEGKTLPQASINMGGIPNVAIQFTNHTLVVRGTNGGALQYTGIPYPAPVSTPTNGGRGTRFQQ